jgi:hypothetical protein
VRHERLKGERGYLRLRCGHALAYHGARAYSVQQMARNCTKPKVY